MGIFERYLSLWVALAIAARVGLGRVAPGLFEQVSRFAWARVNLVVAVLVPAADAQQYIAGMPSSST
jgi:ACR3 family arsenite transporter